MRYYPPSHFERLGTARQSLPAANVAIIRRDAELGQQAAMQAFGSGSRVQPLGQHPTLRPSVTGARP